MEALKLCESACADHWIAGRAVPSRERFEVRSPIDDSLLAEMARGTVGDIDAAVEAARRAFSPWAALGPRGRAPILRRLAENIKRHAASLSALETADNASRLETNLTFTIPRAVDNIEFFAEYAPSLEGGVIESKDVVNHVHYEPAGVAAAITAWNAPLLLATWVVAPALAAGNTVVLKPPEWAPLTSSALGRIATESGLPDGVLNVVHGMGEEAGMALASHPDVDRLSFIGSRETGLRIGATTARRLVPISMGLGGKSPFIVFDDADVELVVRLLASQYRNAGQVCLAGTRILVQSGVAERVLEGFSKAVANLKVGDPRKAETDVGPLITREHFSRVEGFVERARRAGASVTWGGERHPAGELCFSPTLLQNVDQGMEIVQREVFGPVLCLQTFASEDEAIELANGTRYGLAAMVFTKNETRANRIARALVAGTVWVNCYFIRNPQAPFGGARESGVGRHGGRWSFDFFCDVKNVAVRRDSFA
jgi:acyl-CoA reductase-like NAD-dependent aldehyde dehydrogenase